MSIKNEKLTELLGFEPVSLVIQKDKLRSFGFVELKNAADWPKYA